MQTISIPSHLMLLGGEISVTPIYTCDRCGAKGAGDSHRRNILTIERAGLVPQDMPVGWSHSMDGYSCPKCHA